MTFNEFEMCCVLFFEKYKKKFNESTKELFSFSPSTYFIALDIDIHQPPKNTTLHKNLPCYFL